MPFHIACSPCAHVCFLRSILPILPFGFGLFCINLAFIYRYIYTLHRCISICVHPPCWRWWLCCIQSHASPKLLIFCRVSNFWLRKYAFSLFTHHSHDIASLVTFTGMLTRWIEAGDGRMTMTTMDDGIKQQKRQKNTNISYICMCVCVVLTLRHRFAISSAPTLAP